MRTYKSTIFDVFEKHRRYVVPLFQRGYVWTEEGQWQPLWDDLVAQTAELVRQRTQPGAKSHKHFLGALVLNLTHTALLQTPLVEIIDGQQRLTTLQVLLVAIRDEVSALGSDSLRDTLHRLTVNTGSLATPEERFKVWPTSSMQTHLARVLEAGSAEALTKLYGELGHVFKYKKWKPPRPGVLEAYLYFSRIIRLYLDDDPDELPFELIELSAEQRAQDLIEALLHQFHLVTIELDAEDDAQVIFESLNARGEPLTPSDLVRNFVFLTATRKNENVHRLYNDHWRHFEEDPPSAPFWKQDERSGKNKRSRLDLFLYHYITCQTGDELKIGHVYQEFRDWWDLQADRDTETELAELRRYSDIYQQMLVPDIRTPFGRTCHRLRLLDTTTAHPLILWVAGALGADSPEVQSVLVLIESFLIRRLVCGLTPKAYNHLFLDLLRRVRSSNQVSSDLRSFLSGETAQSTFWPPDDQFREHLIRDPLYKTIGPRRTQMILQALEYASHHAFSEDVAINTPLTVEHVLPQHPSEDDWQLEVPDGADSLAEWIRLREVVAHRLGNLTLLTQPLNSSESNGPYSQKRPSITSQSLLALNSYFQNVNVWNESEIELRGTKLADLAIGIWPGP